MNNEEIELAKKARLNAYVPYSDFSVGAVLRTKSGKLYSGCNIENHGLQSICAERTAFVKALSEGEKEFESITIIGGKKDNEPNETCIPCGYCRQFISEFVDNNFKIYVLNKDDKFEEFTVDQLLPNKFKFKK